MTTSHTQEMTVPGQLSLLPPDAYELVIRVGLVPDSAHAQLQVEFLERPGGPLLAMVSRPHFPDTKVIEEMAIAIDIAGEMIRQHYAPFR